MQDDQENPAAVSVRRARHDDYEAFRRLFPELLVDDPIPGLDAWTSALSPSTWLATVDGEVLGYCYVQEYADTGYVRHVVVSPTARQRGFGRALDIPRGQLAAARGMGRLLLEATSSSERAALGLAAFDPKFPGAFPFRVRGLEAVTPLLSAMRQHVPTDRYINLVAEDSPIC